MIATIIGIVGGLIVIMIFTVLKQFDKPTMYGLILSGIGFLYVGFTWTDLPSLIVCCIQAVVFVFIAHFGTRRSMNFMIAGYFLHGLWDLAYKPFDGPKLIPPHYDIFCMTIDFTIGFYLVFLRYWMVKRIAKQV